MKQQLPSHVEAERIVLGSILVDNGAYVSASDSLSFEDFSSQQHADIFGAIQALMNRGEPVDTVTLADELQRSKAAVPVSYVAELVEGLPRLTNVEQWARLVRRASLKRQLYVAARELAKAAVDAEQEPEAISDEALQRLLELAGKAEAKGYLDNAQLVKAALREIELQAEDPDGVLGLRTGLVDLDRALQGLRPGTMGIIAGRAKKGKSLLAMQLGEYVAQKYEGHVAVHSLEMSGIALTKRRLAAIARVNVNRLHLADDSQGEARWGRLVGAAGEITKRRLAINTSAYTVPQIHAACRRLKAEKGLSLVIVDYAQLLDATRKNEKRYLDILEISKALVRLSLELAVPVVVAAQLNREAEGRKDKAPSSADIADGDSLIRACSWCVLIHRDLVPKKGQNVAELKNIAHLILSDNRNGWNGVIRTRFNPLLARFEDLARDEQDAARNAEHSAARSEEQRGAA